MDAGKIARASALEAEAAELRRQAFSERPMPDRWVVGQTVRYIRDQDFGPSRGDVLTIVELDRRGRTPANAADYQVFWTGRPGRHERWWTTPSDVELVAEAPTKEQ